MTRRKQNRHSAARTARREVGVCDKELAALLLPFHQLRVLRYAAIGPIEPAALLSTLRRYGHPLEAPALHRLLRQLARKGWLKCNTDRGNGHRSRSEFILTTRGLDEFRLARRRLMELRKTLTSK
jgi:DNA-binding PadR family transcriptional regulator